jgi:hypothetical protein
MSITTAVCDSYTKEALDGLHQVGDVYKVALIKPASAGAHGAATTNYSGLTTDEVTGTGYTAGGATLTGNATALAAGVASLDFNDAAWTTATFSAAGALIYNSTRANAAVCVLDFGGTFTVTAGTFTLPIDRPVRAT